MSTFPKEVTKDWYNGHLNYLREIAAQDLIQNWMEPFEKPNLYHLSDETIQRRIEGMAPARRTLIMAAFCYWSDQEKRLVWDDGAFARIRLATDLQHFGGDA